MSVDLSNPAAVLAEKERRERCRREGRPFGESALGRPLSGGGLSVAVTAAPVGRPYRVAIGTPPTMTREGDTLTLLFPVPPRTAKNHKVNPATQSVAYRRYVNQILALLEPHRDTLGLPLPEQPYNCAALFTTDNARADTVGLMQGLADALQKARVVTDDRQLRRWDGTDQVHDPLHAGVQLVLTPIPGTP